MSTLEVNKITPQGVATEITLGDSGDTFTIASGATIGGFKSTGIDDNATSTAITIDSSENVGIGTGSPTGGKLHISHGNELGIFTSGPYNFQAKFESTDSEAAIVIEDSNSTNDGNRIGVVGDDMVFITANSERMIIDSDGKVDITRDSSDTSTDTRVLRLLTSASDGSRVKMIQFENSNQGRGSIRSGNSDSDPPSFLAGSDYRFKTNITDYTGGYDKIKAIPVKQFDETTTGATGCVGWIAHEVADHFPDAVEGEKDAVDDEGNPVYQGLASLTFYPHLVQALQKTIEKLESAETKIETLESTVSDLTTRLEALENA